MPRHPDTSSTAKSPLCPTSLRRVEALMGSDAVARLQAANVLVVGLGAVGGACVEALARSGVGHLWLVDGDCFEETNLNRQPFSAHSVLGQSKTDVTLARLADIAPTCTAGGETCFISADNVDELLTRIHPDAVVDAIDDIPSKLALLETCVRQNIPVWSAMGAARKRDPFALRVTDLSETQACPLARNVRQGLRARGIEKGIRCVWSRELPLPMPEGTLGSYMPVTAAAGLLLAADLLQMIIRK